MQSHSGRLQNGGEFSASTDFNRTILDEWAYVRVYASETERVDALDDWIHIYNHHRNHTAIGGPPISRVTNLPAHHN